MTIGRPTDCLHPKGRPCDTSYLVSLKEAGVMAKKRTKRFRSEKKRPTKLRQRSGQFSLPFLPSTPSRITPFPAGDSPLELTHCHLLPRPSRRLSSSPRSSIRVRARRTYLRQLQVERSLPACEPEQHQQSATQAPSNDMPNDLNVGRGTGNRTVFRHSALIDIINKVESEEKDRDRLHGLVTCAEEFKQSQNKSCKCIGIESLGWSWIHFTLPLFYFTPSALHCFEYPPKALRCNQFPVPLLHQFVNIPRIRLGLGGGGRHVICDDIIRHCTFVLKLSELPLIKLKKPLIPLFSCLNYKSNTH